MELLNSITRTGDDSTAGSRQPSEAAGVLWTEMGLHPDAHITQASRGAQLGTDVQNLQLPEALHTTRTGAAVMHRRLCSTALQGGMHLRCQLGAAALPWEDDAGDCAC